ncbi:MAG: hypothetical protein V5A23_07525, partial [Halobacteriales archaeon]
MRVPLRAIRIGLVVVVIALLVPLAAGFLGQTGSPGPTDATTTSSESVTPSPDGTTVRTHSPSDQPEHLVYVVDAAGPAQLTVVDRTTEEVVFKTTEYQIYHDVDPSPAGERTLLYTASNIYGGDACAEVPTDSCTLNVVERVNYSTGETERLYSRLLNYNGSSNTHDVDRISGTEYLVGDIQFDRVFVVNTSDGTVEWTWEAASAFDRSSGGKPDDWTHLNDVEVLDDGRYMANLRNQDQVVFLDRERGLLENWTLGSDGDHEVLYEPHNPDYIPAEMGGPAILIADSENNRIVEYQRRNGTWERTWLWTDERLQWPRDADRLPNNNTLVVDTHGTRILEVAPNGTVVAERSVPRGVYEAELLSTGPESDGGYSMARIRHDTASAAVGGPAGPIERARKGFLDLFPP